MTLVGKESRIDDFPEYGLVNVVRLDTHQLDNGEVEGSQDFCSPERVAWAFPSSQLM